VSPRTISKPNGHGSTTERIAEKSQQATRTAPAPILINASAAAAMLSISKRAFYSLRKRSDFPQDVTVILGPRCVRFRLEALRAFAVALVVTPQREYSWPPARPEIRGR
jgi:predicted DNA-binding transcriptional regulator AlpA